MKSLIKVTILVVALAFAGCAEKELDTTDNNVVTDGPMEGLNVEDSFSYETTKQISVNLSVPDFLNNAVFSIYGKTGTRDSIYIGRASFENESFNRELTVSAATDSILIYSDYIGLTKDVRIGLTSDNITFDYANYYQDQTSERVINTETYQQKGSIPEGTGNVEGTNTVVYNYLSSYTYSGKPTTMASNDALDNSLLDDINSSLPEGHNGGIPNTHPEYLAGKETEIILVEDAEVWITFVSEGAGYRNSLGFYTYTLGQEPTSADDIQMHNIVFPNCSMIGSGGSLVPGNRVYLGFFPANTVISWFLVTNGWSGFNVKNYAQIYYANPDFNPEATGYKDHIVLLQDPARDLNIFGFEDLYRGTGGSDDDFNDAVFYVKSNPVTAISNENVAVLTAANDTDGDGINDAVDEYPDDINKAFNNYYPANDLPGTLAFEDLWPSQGDYDFNDVVTSYHYNLITNGSNKVTEMTASYTIEHIGASFHNGLAFVLPIDPSLVASVTGSELTGGYETTASNGTESGTAANETVIYVSGNVLNKTGDTITVTVNFNTPITISNLGVAPYNTFLIVNGDRTREVHLPDLEPTSKAQSLGTSDDDSDASTGRYYKTTQNLPWALNIFDVFTPSAEKTPITETYPSFKTWVNSSGTSELEWYKN
ncbi:hypothetical protein NBRC110019_03630 [Neptunitalea chrysea]|uniref:LruC domain-containing protein n=1 Tax=Neptunitalea chrysea TaxID=1647581 RepID=A0A9W6B2X0_9FLAO|nr:LruC domain-containing protein [Neptunitalea chrysea]GLB51324.1 hypothetical protein NBRC110019_03630 [Neptunitalea chrysea]